MALEPGTRLGPYEVTGPLGAGGMGEVYRARDTRLGRDVALKVLPDTFASDPDRLKRFEREARATAALSHSNVLTVFDVGSHEGRAYVVTELLDGATLHQRLRRGALPVREALSLATQAARGLAAAHARGIVHRDLKPENLFVTTSGALKILDFGLARLQVPDASGAQDPTQSEVTDVGAVLGTVGYMSPEQVKGLSVDTRSDLFSLGVVCHEMLSGRHPFRRTTSAETTSAILRDDPPMSHSLPPVLDQIVRRCLEKDPEQRFQSARDLEFALSTLSDYRPGGVIGAAVEPKPRQRWLVALVALLALVAVSVASLFLGRRIWERPVPSLQRLTYRRGNPWGARFAPDGQTVVYSASWDGQPCRLFTTRVGSPESRPLDLPDARLLAISRSGEMAILLKLPHPLFPGASGTLARVPMAGGAPREVLDDVLHADFSPDGNELAIVHQVGEHYRVEYPIGKVLLESETQGPVRVSPKGDMVAFNDNEGNLFIVDRQGRKTTIGTGGGPQWSPSGDEVWFTHKNESGTDSSIFAATLSGRKRMVASLVGHFFMYDMFRDGRILINPGELRFGMLALGPSATRERDVSWLSQSVAVGLSLDGRLLLFNEGGHGSLGTLATYLRTTDGLSPAVRLGEGHALGLSYDGKWAVTKKNFQPAPELVLLPTGAGEPRILRGDGIEYRGGGFFPDGKRILAWARKSGQPWRGYIQDIAGGPPRPFLPEGTSAAVISPDGRLVAVHDDATRNIHLYPSDGGELRLVPGPPEPGWIASWSSDGRSLFCVEIQGLVIRIFRRDVASGRRDLLREIAPADPTGFFGLGPVLPAPDGRSYVYTYWRALADLYLVEGLR